MGALAMVDGWAGWCWSNLDGLLVRISIPAWLMCLACLSPALYRLMRRRPRYLDPIWGLVALLTLNRLSFLFHVSIKGSHATAILLALAMAWMSTSYQWHDRAVGS
jgi:hypothetical protein